MRKAMSKLTWREPNFCLLVLQPSDFPSLQYDNAGKYEYGSGKEHICKTSKGKNCMTSIIASLSFTSHHLSVSMIFGILHSTHMNTISDRRK